MRYFEDLQVGEMLTFGGLVVDAAEAEDFARRYDRNIFRLPEWATSTAAPGSARGRLPQ